MSKKTVSRGLMITALAIICSVFLLPGCSEKAKGNRELNLPPDTFISFGPVEATLTYFKVQAFWYGSDEDGDVVEERVWLSVYLVVLNTTNYLVILGLGHFLIGYHS